MSINSTKIPAEYYEESSLYSTKLVENLYKDSFKSHSSESSLSLSKKFIFLSQQSSDSEWRTDLNLDNVITYKNITIEISPEKTLTLPAKLYKLAESIQNSKYILDLEDDFDDEGSPRYDFETWKRAVDFLVNSAKWALDKNNVVIDSPKIYHGPDGSIDILWKNSDYKLLINFPKGNDTPATFYGDDYNTNKIEGTFNPSKQDFRLLHLMLITI